MLSPNSPIYNNLSYAAGRAMLNLQRSVSNSLKIKSTEIAIAEGNSGDASYSARLSSMSDRRRLEANNLQNLISFGQMQDAALESVFSVMDRMGRIAGNASSSLIGSTERSVLSAEFDSLKTQLLELEVLQFQGHNLFDDNCPDIDFPVKIPTTGGIVYIDNVTINGFEEGGEICMDELNMSMIGDSAITVLDPTGSVWGGNFGFSIQPKTPIFRYTSPTGKSYIGDFSKGFQLLEEVKSISMDAGNQKIVFEPASFDNLSAYSVSSESNASQAGAKILDELDTITEKRGKIGAMTNQILLSTDRLDSYYAAEQSHLAKKERDFASTSLDLAKKNLHSKATSALLVQAQGINQNLVSKLI
jgi:flagellin-like hook-associated protein FlgL